MMDVGQEATPLAPRVTLTTLPRPQLAGTAHDMLPQAGSYQLAATPALRRDALNSLPVTSLPSPQVAATAHDMQGEVTSTPGHRHGVLSRPPPAASAEGHPQLAATPSTPRPQLAATAHDMLSQASS